MNAANAAHSSPGITHKNHQSNVSMTACFYGVLKQVRAMGVLPNKNKYNLLQRIPCHWSLAETCRPTNRWFRDGVLLAEKSHKINNKERTLTLPSASPDDNGAYYCCAKNAAGQVCSSTNFTLNIIGLDLFLAGVSIQLMRLLLSQLTCLSLFHIVLSG